MWKVKLQQRIFLWPLPKDVFSIFILESSEVGTKVLQWKCGYELDSYRHSCFRCFLGLVLGFQNAALEAHQNLPGECPATVSQIGIGGKSTAKTCRTFRTSWSLRTCAALQPLKAISKFEKASVFPCWNLQHKRGFSSRRKSQNPNPAQLQEEHAGILGLDGFPKARGHRWFRIARNQRMSWSPSTEALPGFLQTSHLSKLQAFGEIDRCVCFLVAPKRWKVAVGVTWGQGHWRLDRRGCSVFFVCLSMSWSKRTS